MTPAMAIGLVLALAATAGTARWTWRWLRHPASRPARWRMAALLVLQLVATLLLFRVLVPPERTASDATLVVMTAGAGADDAQRYDDAAVRVALPEAGREAALRAGAERMPDLATALRAHPRATRLEVVGQGLEARDIAPARGRAIGFAAAPLPRGVVELQPIGHVVAGGGLGVSGRVHGVDGGRVELLDPSGARQDQAAPDAEGRFRLEGPVRASGPALWRLRVSAPEGTDGAMARIEEMDIPVDVRPGSAPRVLLMAGAPGPEVKYLRRWATDAGLDLHSRMALGGGLALGDGPVDLDAGSLAGFDLAILDERAWGGLGAAAQARLLEAVRAGLGLMLRITAPPDGATEQALHQLGFTLADPGAAIGREVRLAGAHADEGGGTGDAIPTGIDDGNGGDGPDVSTRAPVDTAGDENAPARMPVPTLARQPVQVTATDSVPLLHDAGGVPLAHWRASGRGRVAVWNVDQSFRLVLAGHAERHARLWSNAVGAVARADAPPSPRLPDVARAGERAVLCDLPRDAVVVDPDGTRLHPLPDPAADGCSAVWPRRAGWHRVGDGRVAVHMHVREAGSLPGIEAMRRREAMLALQAEAAGPGTAGGSRPPPVDARQGDRWARAGTGTRWPWFLGWLAAAALLWWLERRRGPLSETPPSGGTGPATRVSREAAPRGSRRGG